MSPGFGREIYGCYPIFMALLRRKVTNKSFGEIIREYLGKCHLCVKQDGTPKISPSLSKLHTKGRANLEAGLGPWRLLPAR